MTNPFVIGRTVAYAFIQQHHYSQVLPRLTKICLASLDDGGIAAVATIGWGVRPLHTIAKAFPGLGTKDYYELGKLCLRDDLPRNSESWFLSRVIEWLKKNTQIKLFWTWADGILGKPGYIYQAANFYYGGYITTEVYLDKYGTKVHPRTIQGISTVDGRGERKSRALSVTEAMGYYKWWGRQFRYVYPLCNKYKWKRLMEVSPFEWRRGNYPKQEDCVWQVQTTSGRRTVDSIPFIAGRYIERNPDQLQLV